VQEISATDETEEVEQQGSVEEPVEVAEGEAPFEEPKVTFTEVEEEEEVKPETPVEKPQEAPKVEKIQPKEKEAVKPAEKPATKEVSKPEPVAKPKEEAKPKVSKPVEKSAEKPEVKEAPKVDKVSAPAPKPVEKPAEAKPTPKPEQAQAPKAPEAVPKAQEEASKPKEKPKPKKTQQAIPKVKPELPKTEIVEAQDYEEPMKELANIGARLERGVSVTELNAAYQANEFPALKRKKSQIAILKAVERVGESAVVQQVLAQEFPESTTADESQAGNYDNAGFQALLTTLANESHKIEEIITQVQPEDFSNDQVVEERFAKIVHDSQELVAAPQVA